MSTNPNAGHRHRPTGLVGLVGCLLLASSVSAVAISPRQQDAAVLQPWVTVAADGAARTVIPTITTVNGVATTLSTFPGTKTSAPTALPNGEAAFLVCDNEDGAFAPFCTPDATSRLETGNTYFITWDPNFFENAGLMLQLQADMLASDDGSFGGRDGVLISEMRTAADGFVRWQLNEDWLADGRPTNLSFFFSLPDATSGTIERKVGPLLRIFPGAGDRDPGGVDNNALRIALPVTFGVLGLVAVAGGCWFCRRKASGQGYGIRKSRIQRLSGTATKGGIRMDDYGETLPRAGQNVFREEVRRQGRTGM